MKRIARLLLFGKTLLWLLGGCTPEEMLLRAGLIEMPQDDFQVGLSAYQRGDYAAAHRAWRPLAKHGHAEAQYNLGLMYNTGRGIPRDDVQAVHWYHMAADQGVALAQLALGLMYAESRRVPQDDVQAMHWYRMAADQGAAEAQLALGLMYLNVRYVKHVEGVVHVGVRRIRSANSRVDPVSS